MTTVNARQPPWPLGHTVHTALQAGIILLHDIMTDLRGHRDAKVPVQQQSILWSNNSTSYCPFLYPAATWLSITAESNAKQTLIGPYWSILESQGWVILQATTETPSLTSWVMESSVGVQVGVASQCGGQQINKCAFPAKDKCGVIPKLNIAVRVAALRATCPSEKP